MMRYPLALLFLLALSAPAALAQQPSDGLSDQQRLGRQLLSQSCGVCHLPPARGARTYGPVLHKGSSGGDAALMRKLITEGTPRVSRASSPNIQRCSRAFRASMERSSRSIART